MENYAHLPELKKQLEYYLSDSNLSRDQFFYSKIQETDDGFITLDNFQKCNNVKKLNATTANLIDAIKDSSELELNEAQTAVRRVGNKELPEFKAQKKLKTSSGEGRTHHAKEDEEQAHEADDGDSDIMVPVILFIRDISGLEKNGRALEEALGEKYQIQIPFARIGSQGDGGHVLLDKSATEKSVIEELTTKGFELNGKVIKFDLGTDRDRDAFLKEHGSHVNRIIKRKFQKKLGKAKRDMKKGHTGALEFDGVKYPSLEAFKSRFKGLITKTKNDAEISEDGKQLLLALLKFHKNSDEKLSNVKGFTVGFHPTFDATRCFFIIREDGTKEDFSYHKCIHNLVNSKL